MQKTRFKKMLSVLVCAVLIAAMALTATGCSDNKATDTKPTSSVQSTNPTDDNVLGVGKNEFNLTVTGKNGKSTDFVIKTDKTVVGEALQELKIIEGEEGDYGLYIKSVNGVVADYDIDKTYWAFYIDGEYALTGIDQTNIEKGKKYQLKVETME